MQKILVECSGPVTTVIINRPQAKNALDNEAAHALAAAFATFDADENAKVAVLTGAGGAFCATSCVPPTCGRTRWTWLTAKGAYGFATSAAASRRSAPSRWVGSWVGE